MKVYPLSWYERLVSWFNLEPAHHRVCRLCQRPIYKMHKYRHIKVGPFRVDKVEHKDCSNPTMGTAYQLAQRFIPELPFEEPKPKSERFNQLPRSLGEMSTPIWDEYDPKQQENI